MNTYDPRDRIVYRHMDQRQDPYPGHLPRTPRTDRLPSGYPNASPRTYLGSGRRRTPAA